MKFLKDKKPFVVALLLASAFTTVAVGKKTKDKSAPILNPSKAYDSTVVTISETRTTENGLIRFIEADSYDASFVFRCHTMLKACTAPKLKQNYIMRGVNVPIVACDGYVLVEQREEKKEPDALVVCLNSVLTKKHD